MKRKLNGNDEPEAVSRVETLSATTAPNITVTFASLGLDARLLQAVEREKFSAPTPVQSQAIPLVLGGKDVLARAKTGSGKTLAYLLPLLHFLLSRIPSSSSQHARHTSALVLVPTKELAAQVAAAIKSFTAFCGNEIRGEHITRKEDAAVTRTRLADTPDIVVATPSRAVQWVDSGDLKIGELKRLVIDEADLLLSYGYEEDLKSLASALPPGVQTLMMSATLRTETDTLASLFCKTSSPAILDLSAAEAAEKATVAHYIVQTAEEDKFLLIYAIFKLQLIKGKVIVFVADIDRCYRVKLFLEQFGVRACVLNSELPVNSRLHVVEEFNRGVYDIIVAADGNEVVGNEGGRRKRGKTDKNEDAQDDEEGREGGVRQSKASRRDQRDTTDEPTARPFRKANRPSRVQQDAEYGVSRGIDFRHVTCVLNFDLPTSSKSYIHRTGRTARAGETGMALSFCVPKELYRKHKPTSIEQCKNDEEVLEKIRKNADIQEWGVDWEKLAGFRYRLGDALRAVTRIAVREARTRELRQELIASEKLQRHFEENPDDLRHLRHDGESHAVRSLPHLKHVPDYLLPTGGKQAISKDVGYVGLKKDKENRIRKARAFNKMRKGRVKRKALDPLKSLNARGRGKK